MQSVIHINLQLFYILLITSYNHQMYNTYLNLKKKETIKKIHIKL